MNDSIERTRLLEGKAKKLKELVDLASKELTKNDAAQRILRDLAEIDAKLLETDGLDYREDKAIDIAIVRYLQSIRRPASEAELTDELIRGQLPGYENQHKLATRVGRCVYPYANGWATANDPLKYRNRLVGLSGWADEMFS